MTYPSAGSSLNKETPKGKQSGNTGASEANVATWNDAVNIQGLLLRVPGHLKWERAGGGKEKVWAEGSSIEPGVQSLFRAPWGHTRKPVIVMHWETQQVNPGSSQLCFMWGHSARHLTSCHDYEKVRVFIAFVKVKTDPQITFVEHLITVPLSP